MIEALRHPQFRLLWCGSLFTYAGHWIHQVVFAWVAYELTGSGAVVGAVLGFRAIPILLLASLSGVAADRYSRRHLLMGASLVNVIGALLMGALIVSGIAFVVALVGIALSPTLAIALPFVVLAGIGEMVTTAAGQALMQLSAPASMRGRVLSLLQFNPALISIGSVAIGVGADLIGARGITLAATGAALVAGVVMIVKAPDLFTLRASTLQSKAE